MQDDAPGIARRGLAEGLGYARKAVAALVELLLNLLALPDSVTDRPCWGCYPKNSTMPRPAERSQGEAMLGLREGPQPVTALPEPEAAHKCKQWPGCSDHFN